MAKNKRTTNDEESTVNTTETETETMQAATNGAATVDEPKADERYRVVTHPETGQAVKRKDYILELWTQKRWSRGEIAKHLTQICGKKVPYQIVFAATKDVPGGPAKAPVEDGAPASA